MIMLPISVIIMIMIIGKDVNFVGTAGGIICDIQIVPLIGSVFFTEKALKKNFDENGNRM